MEKPTTFSRALTDSFYISVMSPQESQRRKALALTIAPPNSPTLFDFEEDLTKPRQDFSFLRKDFERQQDIY